MKKIQILKSLATFSIAVSIYSCSQKESSNQGLLTGELGDFIADTLYLEKDFNTQNLPNNLVYIEKEGRQYLYAFIDHRLLQYEYPSGKLLGAKEFEKEGPDGIGNWISGHLIDKDQLFVISNGKNILKVDHDGKVLNRFDLPDDNNPIATVYGSMNGNPMYWNEKNQILSIKNIPHLLKENSLGIRNWILTLNLEQNSHEFIPFQYPDEYRNFLDDPALGVYSSLWLPDQNIHVISFPATDSLLVLAGKDQYWKDGGSREPLKFLAGTPKQEGEYIIYLSNSESSRYGILNHDIFRKKIWRNVVYEAVEKEDGEFYHKMGFIIIDESLQKVAELAFDSNKFSNSGFATRNGFYLKLAEQQSDDYEGYVRVVF